MGVNTCGQKQKKGRKTGIFWTSFMDDPKEKFIAELRCSVGYG